MSLPAGPQPHPVTLVSWTLAGSAAEVLAAAAGPNWTEGGVTAYGQGNDWPNFGNALAIPAAPPGHISNVNAGQLYNQNAGAIEMFVKFPTAMNNGIIVGVGIKACYGLHKTPGGPYTDYHDFFFTAAGLNWRMVSVGVAGGFVGAQTPAIMDSLANVWNHIAAVWDTTGIDGGANTMRIYWNNALAVSTNNAITMPTLTVANLITVADLNTLVSPFGGSIDNIKVWNYAKTDFAFEIANEGYPVPPPPDPPARVPELFDVKTPRVEVMGQDIVCRLSAVPKVMEQRSIGSDLVFPADCKVTLDNFDSSFSLEHPRSLFAGTNWQNQRVEIWDRSNMKIWDGLLASLQIDEGARTTSIVSRSRLYEWRDKAVVYTSAVPETPAEALENIALAIGFPYLDTAFLVRSKDRQDADGLTLTVTLADTDGATFAQVLNTLADYGCADVYEHLGSLRYDYYNERPPSVYANLNECDYVSRPKETRPTRDLMNSYAIAHGANVETDAGNGNIGAVSRGLLGSYLNKRIPGEEDTKYALSGATAAVALGEQWIKRTHIDLATRPRPRIMVQFDLEILHRVWVDLSADFTMSLERESWVEKVFRVVGFTRDDNTHKITITGMEW